MEARLAALAQASAEIFAAPSLDASLRLIADAARALVGARRAVVTLDGSSGAVPAHRCISPPDDSAPDPGASSSPALTAPLLGRDGRRLGLIEVGGTDAAAFDSSDEAVIAQLARLAALALDNVRLVEAARAAEQRFHQFAGMASDWLWESDAEHRIVFVDGPPTVAAGFALGKRRWEFGGADPERPEWKRHRRVLALRERFRNFEYTVLDNDGQTRHFSLNGDPVFDPAGGFIGYRGTSTDVTARRAAEEALKGSESRFRDFAEVASDWLWETDAQHRLLAITGNSGPIDDRPLGRTRWELCGQTADHPDWRDHVADLAARRPFRDFAFVLRDGSGRVHHLVANGRPHFDAAGRFLGYRGTTTDRTAQHLAERAAAESERKFRQIVETAQEGIWILDTERRTVYVNPRLCQMLGYAPEEIIGRKHWEFLGEEDRARAIEIAAVRHSSAVEQREYRYRRKDGTGVWALITSNPLPDENGESQGILGMLVDITARKEADARAARAKREVEAILASVSDGFVAIDNDGRFTYMNAAAERIVGRKAQDVIGRSAAELLAPGPDNLFAQRYAEAKRDGQPASFTAWSAALGLWLEIRAYPHPDGLTIFFRDVSAERQAHVALADSERQLRTALEEKESVLASISDAFVTLDNEWRFTFVNATAERLWRVRAEDLIGQSSFGLHKGPSNPFFAAYAESKRSGEPIAFTAYSEIFDRWLEVRGYPHPAGYSVFFRDVSDERRVQRELLASRQRLEAAREINERLFETSLDLICITDAYGNFVQMNPGTSQQFGYPLGEMIGRNASDYIHPDDIEGTRAALRAARLSHRPRNFENRCRRADGVYVHVNWSMVWSEAERNYFLIGRDMSERIAAQEQLNRAQRLQAIGQLTGGIAHDFNNLLTVIMGNSDILSQALKREPNLRRHAELNVAAARRAAALTAQLLAFSRRQALTPGTVDPNRLLIGLRELLVRTLGAQIEIALALDPATWHCKVDPTQLETALLNLAVNARDAMSAGGRLRIATFNRVVAPGDLRDLAPGDYAVIEVTDTGAGMTPDVMARVFEPFFTTKDVGKGSGLGLAMVYGFVNQSGGHVTVESAPGRGSVFRLFLPRLREAAQGDAPADRMAEGPLPRGQESVLVVEDDEAVRELVTHQLAGLGYRVTAAGNGVDARKILDGDGAFDLLFTDIMMPGGVSGVRLAADAAERRPGLRVLLTTGHAAQADAPEPGPASPPLLRKPYKLADLAAAIRGALERSI